MKQKRNRHLIASLSLIVIFVLFTLAVRSIDLRPIGPNGSVVGFGALNGAVHGFFGVHMTLYTVTDWAGLVPLAVMLGFAVLGLVQLLRRRSLRRVDGSLLVLGGFYLLVLAAYIIFEFCVINRRPVLIGGVLEASYPSSTTMLALCVFSTAIAQLRARIGNAALRAAVTAICTAFCAFMVLGRLISGVHWFSDILGGVLLSAALAEAYCAGVAALGHADAD